VFTIIQFFYGFLNNFSGQTIIDDWYITLFNLLFTSLPLGARACLEFDIKPEDGIMVTKLMPWLYSETRDDPIFTFLKFFLKLLKGLIHCIINYLWVIYSIDNNIVDDDGNNESLWLISVNLFSNIIIIVSIDLMIYTNFHTWINIVIMLVSTFIFYIIFLIMVHYMKMFNSVGSMKVSFLSSRVWMNIIFICGICFLIDKGIQAYKFLLYPNYASTLQRIISENGKCDNEKYLPKTLIEKVKIYDEVDDNIEEKVEKNEGFIYQANTTGRVIPFTVIKT
jgi:magnesium-transporting ATPase (P-type)